MWGEPVVVVAQVATVLDRLEVSYLVGGSLANSMYGVPRATQDVDLVADLSVSHAQSLAEALKDEFYVDSKIIRDAIARRGSFTVIHLATMFEVRKGGEVSDRQWNDVLGILKIQSDLDRVYLEEWAIQLRIEDLFARAGREVENRA